jgi:Tol biopolymer transport system component
MKKITSILMVSTMLLSTFSAMLIFCSEAQVYPEIIQLTKDDVNNLLPDPPEHVLNWDGNKLLFSRENERLYVMNTADNPGTEKMLVTGGMLMGWALSADSNTLVFSSCPSHSYPEGSEVYVMNTADNPGDEIQITSNNLIDHIPNISGNGEKIAWHSSANSRIGFDIVVANISDMSNVEITRLNHSITGLPPDDNEEFPCLTYDGDLVSFWHEAWPSTTTDVFLINSDGTDLRNISNSPEYEIENHQISSDGSRMAFTRRVGNDLEIFVYDIAYDTLTQLTYNDADDRLGGINGDGNIVTYWRDGHIFMYDMTTNAETQLTFGNFNDQRSRISGDGSVIVFMSNRDGSDLDIFMIRLQEQISASVDIDPDTLNLKSNGQWITAYITLPEGYTVEDIVLETVYLDGVPAAWSEIQNGVYMTKFDRETLQTRLTNEPDYDSAPKFYDLTLAVTGELVDGTPFEGSDTIRVLSK